MAGVNNYGPYYENTGLSIIYPWGFEVPGVNSPLNTNVEETKPVGPQLPVPPPPPPVILKSNVATDLPVGTFSLVASEFINGDVSIGGVLGSGGTVVVSVPDSLFTYSGTIDSGATWQITVLEDQTHYYVLTCNLSSDLGGSGILQLQTVNIGLGLWSGEANILSLSILITNFGNISGNSGKITQ